MEDALRVASPLLSGIGGGNGGGNKDMGVDGNTLDNSNTELKVNTSNNYSNDMFDKYMQDPSRKYKQGGKLRYNPRKYDYVKGNTFGLK